MLLVSATPPCCSCVGAGATWDELLSASHTAIRPVEAAKGRPKQPGKHDVIHVFYPNTFKPDRAPYCCDSDRRCCLWGLNYEVRRMKFDKSAGQRFWCAA